MYGTTANLNLPTYFFLAARDQTAKFKDRQYFRLYGMLQYHVEIVGDLIVFQLYHHVHCNVLLNFHRGRAHTSQTC